MQSTASQVPPFPAAGDRKALPEPRHPDTDRIRGQLDVSPPPGDWPALGSVPVSILVPVRNEETNIVECLRRLRWANEIAVIDSQSRDRTIPLAQAMGADVYQFYFN